METLNHLDLKSGNSLTTNKLEKWCFKIMSGLKTSVFNKLFYTYKHTLNLHQNIVPYFIYSISVILVIPVIPAITVIPVILANQFTPVIPGRPSHPSHPTHPSNLSHP